MFSEKMRSSLNYRNCTLFVIQLFICKLLLTTGMAKYLFVLLGIMLIIAYESGNVSFNLGEFWLFSPFLFYIFWGTLIALYKGNFTFFSVKQILFYLLPPLMALVYRMIFKSKCRQILDYIFLSFIIIYFLENWKVIIQYGKAEHTLAFVFGLFSIYYFYESKYVFFIFTIPVIYLTNKRIVVLVTALCFIFALFLKLLKTERKKYKMSCGVMLCIFIGTFIYSFSIISGLLNKLTLTYAINTQGRTTIYERIVNENNIQYFEQGKGIGFVLNYLSEIKVAAFSNLHSDTLGIYIEIGIVGAFVFYFLYLYAIYKNYYLLKLQCKQKNIVYKLLTGIIVLVIYTLINFLTDNISIYISYLFPFYFMIFSYLNIQEIESEDR